MLKNQKVGIGCKWGTEAESSNFSLLVVKESQREPKNGRSQGHLAKFSKNY